MHLLVTDRLACPRCGPGFALILLADELTERRVLQGSLGCPNCRERYPVRDGYGDLRPSPRQPQLSPAPVHGDDAEGTLRTAALLGVQKGPGMVLVSGPSAGYGERLAAMIEDIEVVAVHPDLREAREAPGVSRLAMGDRFPFQTGSLRGVLLHGVGERAELDEGLRVLAPGARLVLIDPPPGSDEAMRAMGLELLLESEGTLVGARK